MDVATRPFKHIKKTVTCKKKIKIKNTLKHWNRQKRPQVNKVSIQPCSSNKSLYYTSLRYQTQEMLL